MTEILRRSQKTQGQIIDTEEAEVTEWGKTT